MTSKVCALSGETFEISEMERELLRKMGLREPFYSPKVREAMRLAFRNERNLYLRNCDFSGERIISIYSEDKPFPVYKYEHWISDKWTTPELPYDFSKPFFEQYAALSKITPRANSFAPYNENCDYCNAAEKNKNCYMHILSDRSEDCYYTHGSFNCKDCIDSAFLYDSELCFESVDCRACYHCRNSYLCDNCSNCDFCFNMRGCQDCFMCSDLQNQKFCIQNKAYSKEEYEKRMGEIHFGSFKVFSFLKEKFVREVMAGKPYVRLINIENSDGNFLINTKNCHKCFDVEGAQDCMYYRIGANGCKDVVDSHAVVDGSELIYGNVSTTESYNCHNVIGCWTSKNCCYGEFNQGCENCIGCISLRYKKNCVFNKQYSEEEFNKIKAHIQNELGESWGHPFPFKLAPFSYLESACPEYNSLTKAEVEHMGWRYGQERVTEQGETHPVSELTDDIGDLKESKLDEAYECARSHKSFKIIPQEIRLLKKIVAPLPRFHHEIRHQDRVQFRKKPNIS